MNSLIACCGIKCIECEAFIATQKDDVEELNKIAQKWSNEEMKFNGKEIACDGCKSNGKLFGWSKVCDIRICCDGKEIENCAYCEEYPCEILNKSHERSPMAKQNLEVIRENL